MDSSELDKYLIEKLESEIDDEWGSGFKEKSPVTCELTETLVGTWLCVKAVLNYDGVTFDPSTDRLSGDPEDVHAWYTWIGVAEDAPKKVIKPEELDEWALHTTYYRLTFRDVQYPGPFGFHEGCTVKDFTLDGKGEMIVVTERRFQDVAPISTCKIEPFDLSKVKTKKKKSK